jgi:hypothetical protein
MSFEDNNTGKKKREYLYQICPWCKSKIALDRRFCKCFYDMTSGRLPVYMCDDNSDILEPVNVETGKENCEHCGLGCGRCYSFSVLKKNNAGFGGQDCEHKQDHIRCTCCQMIINKFLELDTANRTQGNIDKMYSEAMATIQGLLRKTA